MADDLFDDDQPEVNDQPWLRRTKVRAVRRDQFDALDWEMLLGNTEGLREQVMLLEMDFPTSRPAWEDLYNLLMRNSPRFEDEAEMADDYRPQYPILTSTSDNDAFQFVRKFTTHDPYYTTKALLDLAGPLRSAFEALRQAQEDSAPFCPWPPPSGGGGSSTDETGEGGPGGLPSPVDFQPETPEGVTNAMLVAVRKSTDEMEAEEALIESFGVEDGTLKRMSYEERRAMVQRLSKGRLAKLANILGPFRASGTAQRRQRVVHAPGEVVGITQGNDLTRLSLPELVNLATPELSDLWLLRYVRQELDIEETRGFDRVDRGPIIVVCDESESMDRAVDLQGNTREAWSKAVSLAMSDHARHDKRDFIYIGFSNARQVWETVFPKGQGSLDQVIAFAEHFFAGGTHYERPLRRAMEIVESYARKGKVKPDILFLTDGACAVPPTFVEEWRELRQRLDVKCYGVQIGSPPNGVMRSLVDRALPLTRLNAGPEGMAEVFRSI